MRWLWIAVGLGLGLMLSAGATGTGSLPRAAGEGPPTERDALEKSGIGGLSAQGAGAEAGTVEKAAEESAILERADNLSEVDDFAQEPYTYRSAGRRDPFVSLLEQDDEESDEGLPGIGDLYIVGIAWGAKDRFALAETRHGRSLILREGDALRDGRVVTVRPDGVTVTQHYYGMTRRVQLPIVSGEEVGDER
ncbi:MAG: hypothetical protein KAY32_17635 [Candidatus Eisenbacteria sp.]|nr:hypothetical protein [Candidatus Eisenbacteria bacterium]